VPGYKTAWLLWPDTDNWREGELDFPEGNLTGRIGAFAHHAGDPQQQDSFPTTTTYTTWHTATTEWAPGRVTFILDGVNIGSTTRGVPSTSMHFVLQTETCIDSGCVVPNTAAGMVQVDWISIYSRA
jgi:beta-glucanase (GH16 family)